MTIDIIAAAIVCHEVNGAYCLALGDTSQVPWADAPQWQRESAVKGVQFIIDNPDAPPSASHESWLAEKEKDGWTYGEVKNPQAKTHPCFVPYDQLPVEQRAKDYIFGAIVRTMMGGIDYPTPDAMPGDVQAKSEQVYSPDYNRQLALNHAMELMKFMGGLSPEDVVKAATILETYLRGDAK